jgi:hypothetical protein
MLIATLLLLTSSNIALATLTTINVAEDTEITSWANWSNDARGLLAPSDPPTYFGGNLRVAIGAFPNGAYAGTSNVGEVLMRWDLTSIPANHVITGATLRMIQFDGSVGVTNVYQVNQGTWTEASVSWNSWNGQTTSSTLLGGMLGTPGSVNNGETLFTNAGLVSAVQGWHDGSHDNLGLILKWGGANDDGDTYSSRERTDVDPPQLILEHHAVPEPSSVIMLFSAVAMSFRRCRYSLR